MAIKKAKPTTPGLRGASFEDFSDITTKNPHRALLTIRKQFAGRNAQGKITVRHRGGGVKRYIRTIDFKRDKFGVPGTIKTIEYDPNRGSRIGLIFYKDGEKRYMIVPAGLEVGTVILSDNKAIEPSVGNAMPLEHIPVGLPVHNVELEPGKGGQLARGAGNALYIMSVEKKYAQLKLPSGEIRLVKKECLGTIGQVGNADRRHVKLGKAGRSRLLGRRPTVRGTAMNPVDHPHGGGEGNQPIGLKHPKTKWGKNAYGVPTRSKKKASGKLIIQSRKGRKK
ncbi:MAG: 50S ribosomal protein L2 [Patescibacteria group bacterium]|nr:MAG: 50S ribosomal protein L2 [Patescibacteria group bacterium]